MKTLPFAASLLVSLGGWILVGGVTVILSLAGLFILWPLSVLFQRASGELPHRVSQLWARTLTRLLPFWEIHVTGLERIKRGKPYVVVLNHQSMLDILALLARLPLHFKFIVKKELFRIPFFGWHLASAGYICLKRGDPESGRACLEKAREWLRRGVSVIFFPEGTRSPDGLIHEFKPGAFKLALEEKADFLPLVVAGTREAIPKYSWRIERRAPLFLKVLEPVSTEGKGIQDLDAMRQNIRENIMSEFDVLKGEIQNNG